jgi:hypothetical protein
MHSRSGEFIEVLPAWKLIGFNWPWVIADGLTLLFTVLSHHGSPDCKSRSEHGG